MIAGWAVVLTALLYICGLFVVAHWGDVSGRRLMRDERVRPTVYALSLAVYCTSWTFFGSVGGGEPYRARLPHDLCRADPRHRLRPPPRRRVVRIAKAQNSTSIADFVAARYGKSERIAALVCVIALIGAIPLHRPATARRHRLAPGGAPDRRHPGSGFSPGAVGDLGLFVALVLAGFAVRLRHAPRRRHRAPGRPHPRGRPRIGGEAPGLPGGRRLRHRLDDERHAGAAAGHDPAAHLDLVGQTSGIGTLAVQTLLSAGRCCCCRASSTWRWWRTGRSPTCAGRLDLPALPRAHQPVRGAAVALAGLALFPHGTVERDMTVVALPLSERADGISRSSPSSAACRPRPRW